MRKKNHHAIRRRILHYLVQEARLGDEERLATNNGGGRIVDGLGVGEDSLGLRKDRLGARDDGRGLREDRLRIGDDRLGLGEDGLGVGDDSLGLREDGLGVGDDGGRRLDEGGLRLPEDGRLSDLAGLWVASLALEGGSVEKGEICHRTKDLNTSFYLANYVYHNNIDNI